MFLNTNAYRSGTISDLNRDNSVASMLRTKIGALASCVNVISAISEMVHKEAMPFKSVSDNSMIKKKQIHLLLMNKLIWHCNANILLNPKLKAQQLAREKRFHR
jgi:hypothetical protein